MTEIAIMVAAMIATGIVSGIIAGLLGVGGGIVMVPVLDFVLVMLGVPIEIRMHIAVATSLAVIVPTSIASAKAHHVRGAVDVDLVNRWAVFIVLGSVAGIVIASRVDGTVLSAIFGIMALVVAVKMALPIDDKTLTDEVPRGLVINVVPTIIGGISSMIGIGGGSMTVPALTLMNTPIHRAVATSALFGLFISLPGTIGFIVAGWGNELLPVGSLGFVNLLGFFLIAPISVLAAPVGAKIAHAASRRTLNSIFAVFLLLIAIRMLSRTWL